MASVVKSVGKLLRKSLNFVKKRWYLVLIVVAVLGYFGYRQMTASVGEKNEPYRVKLQTLHEELTFSGEVDAEEKADLQFQTGGRLAWIGVKEGDAVNKWQSIASLDQRQVRKTLDKYLNTYVKTRLQFEQQQDDSEDIGGISAEAQRELRRLAEESQADLNNSVLDVELQTITIEYSNLSTPIAGVVDRVLYPVAGVNIPLTSTAAPFRIVNPETLFFAAEVDQTDVVNIQEGQEGTIVFDPYPDEEVPAYIDSISFSPIEGETGTVYEVKIGFLDELLKSEYKYRLGMTGDISFIIREIPDVVAVPSNYVDDEGEKQFVLKDVNGKAEKTFVETGDTIDSQTIITSGLKVGDVIYD